MAVVDAALGVGDEFLRIVEGVCFKKEPRVRLMQVLVWQLPGDAALGVRDEFLRIVEGVCFKKEPRVRLMLSVNLGPT